jgi:hypothetical protein
MPNTRLSRGGGLEPELFSEEADFDYEDWVEEQASNAYGRQIGLNPYEQNPPVTSFKEGLQNYIKNFKNVNTNIFADTIHRVNQLPDTENPQELTRNVSNAIGSAATLAKENNFDSRPESYWSHYLDRNTTFADRAEAEDFKDRFQIDPSVISPLAKQKGKEFLDKFKFPDFIAEPLKLRNPVVSPESGLQPGQFLNARGAEFLRDFEPVTVGDKRKNVTYASPFGSRVFSSNVPANQGNPSSHDIAFQGPEGYESKQAGAIRDPLLSPALHYTLGQALEDVPVGSDVTANPMGGSKGPRARAYRMLTKGALTSDPFGILSRRVGPTTWESNIAGTREFDPGSLKDSLIRTIYNMPETQDVSNLRNNPLGLLQRTNRVDFTKPVLTTDSPIYRARQGIKASILPGAADLIPSPEAIDSFYANKPVQGAQQMAGDFARGLPIAAAFGTATALAPQATAALNPLTTGVAGGMLAIRGAQALNRVVEHQTGEGLQSKWEQALGVRRRTGAASPGYRQSLQPNYTPQTITQMTPTQRTEHLRQISLNPLQKGLELAKQRFNPSRLEFGFSEAAKGAGDYLRQLPGQIPGRVLPGMLSTFFQRR